MVGHVGFWRDTEFGSEFDELIGPAIEPGMAVVVGPDDVGVVEGDGAWVVTPFVFTVCGRDAFDERDVWAGGRPLHDGRAMAFEKPGVEIDDTLITDDNAPPGLKILSTQPWIVEQMAFRPMYIV